ncbi:hypothetical protein [Halostagnicola kamekurae]|uniref:Uncharacterized protein n=1 Tax=Halostagnicola kamekurae TaxID=619731 RepID=A0A1I6UY70_9EURY|nr:hypothetical protein [Halostagnicola kamekurae]SFT06376.1 hypothetical protein SAMN04488556_4169 [Halostagnicola kamekurae]
MISVESIMDTPDGRDEVGTPDDMLAHCERHDVIYRVGGNCLECEREHTGRKADAQEREAERELETRREAKAVAGPEHAVRTDGGEEVSE